MEKQCKDKVYRVREGFITFTIEVYGYKTTGILWWKRKTIGWYRADMSGEVYKGSPNSTIPPTPEYESLNAAKEQIKYWQNGPTYHEIEP